MHNNIVLKDTDWIGVDFDKTLATYEDFVDIETIGKPISYVVELVKKLISKGFKVKIFTARATRPELIPAVKEWVKKHIGHDLEVTNVKDFDCGLILDDRARTIVPNKGKVCCGDKFVIENEDGSRWVIH